MESFIEDLLDDVGSLGSIWLLLIVFGLAFAETALFADLVVPGEVGMVLIGAAVARSGDPHLAAVILAAALGATLGDSVGWLLGRHVGPPFVDRWEWTRRRLKPKLERAQTYFERRGGAAVFLGRFVGALRAVISVVAGASRMPYPRFLAWNVLASLCWAGLVVSLGFAFGRNISSVVDNVGLVITGAVVLGAAVWWYVRRRRRADPSGQDA